MQKKWRMLGSPLFSFENDNVTRLFNTRCTAFFPRCGHNKATGCVSPTSSDIIRRRCQGRTSCRLRASNSVFGNPCRGVVKYIEIKYECSKCRIHHGHCCHYCSKTMIHFRLKEVDQNSVRLTETHDIEYSPSIW